MARRQASPRHVAQPHVLVGYVRIASTKTVSGYVAVEPAALTYGGSITSID